MEFNIFKRVVLFFTVFVFISCSKEDLIINDTNEMSFEDSSIELEPIIELDPLIEFDFSTSPIDLLGTDAQFVSDIPYDEFDKTRFDFFMPNSSAPTGLAIFIHGGGFIAGDKSFIYNSTNSAHVINLLENNIAVASINYRLLDQQFETEGVLKCLHDARRAVQFIRFIHNELNIDKNNIVLYGSSAGAGISLWLGVHNDFRDESNVDPVLRESSRVKGVSLGGVQASYDIENRWVHDVLGEFDTTWEDLILEFGTERFFQFYGVHTIEEYNSPAIDRYRKDVDMLSMLSTDDPEIWVENTHYENTEPHTLNSLVHHPYHAKAVKDYADAVGVPNVSYYGNPILYSDPSDEAYIDFIIRKINE
ncbi:hypothetical protein ULMS_13600 [Patiriisocius marinistellae]|uniref:BD-FAE-like domain-containing protein n=1 Tax=Patiriisocius marinistellae TaxID=2494560 RepID=A0A5J4FXH4_9FLAO|nr:alpha/beta hydrolase [Patiriisocius marinistellae]GEQ85852.1 hypothetical protein ULMS_13600 [Patiriisocius marinistellae]